MQLEKELDIAEISAALNPKRRIVVLQREDGLYTYAQQFIMFRTMRARS